MITDPAQIAISAALKGLWDKAIEANLEILEKEPENTEALNRLARAYCETRSYKKAKIYAKKVLKLDPFNPIANKCLKKLNSANGAMTNVLSSAGYDAKTFLEEPGKTKITPLLNLGDSKTLASLSAGHELKLNAFKHRVSVTTTSGMYVGRLTDDLSARLRHLIKEGNKYLVLVKSVEPDNVKVFIREIQRAERISDTPSFPTERIDYISFTPPELVHKKDTEVYEEN